jgi:hypothetical protein
MSNVLLLLVAAHRRPSVLVPLLPLADLLQRPEDRKRTETGNKLGHYKENDKADDERSATDEPGGGGQM